MIVLMPVAIPMVEPTTLLPFPTRGWQCHSQKPMEEVVNRIPDDHLFFTFLATAPLRQLVALGWPAAKYGDGVALLSGSLKQWMSEIELHCRDESYPAEVRRFYNAVVVFFTHLGLDRLFNQYKRTLTDGTFVFTE